MVTMEAPTTPATPTECKVAELLLTNTGSHFLDSGGAYGRAWQHTRAKYGLNPSKNSWYSGSPLGPDPDPDEVTIEHVALAMRDEPRGSIDSFGSVTVDTFHWLVDRLEFDPALAAKYDRWQRVTNFGKDRWDKDWGLPLVDRFLDLIEARGLYGEGKADIVNTYNHEDALDRTLQFALFSVRDEKFLPEGTYVLLQIHGGADVRGGYTDPVLFVVNSDDDSDLYDLGRVEVYCEGADEIPGGTPGQLDVDGHKVQPIHHSHRWDNSDDNGGTLRLTYCDGEWLDGSWPEKQEQVLVFLRETDEDEDTIIIEHGYTTPEGKVVRPEKRATANNSLIEHVVDTDGIVIGHHWPCPFDGSTLRAMGAIA